MYLNWTRFCFSVSRVLSIEKKYNKKLNKKFYLPTDHSFFKHEIPNTYTYIYIYIYICIYIYIHIYGYFALSRLLASDFLLFKVLFWNSIKKFKVPGSQVLGPSSWVLDPGSWLPSPRSWVSGSGSRIPGSGPWVLILDYAHN